jgi:hypothetical protein
MYNEIISEAIDIGIDGEVGAAVTDATQMMTQLIAEQLAPALGAEIADKAIVQLEPFGTRLCATSFRVIRDASGAVVGLAKSTLQLGIDTTGSVYGLVEDFKNVNNMLTVGNQNIAAMVNGGVVGFGVYSTGASALGFSATTDKKARAFYSLSMLCSMSAITSSGAAIVAKSCNISGVGLASETAAMAFLKLGNRARAVAYQLEGRPLPKGLEKYYDPGLRARINSGDLGFIMPGHISPEILDNIPFELIGKIIGSSLAIYGYSRLVITCYRYGQKLITKYRSIRKKKLILKQARFLVSALTSRPSVYKDFISRNYINCHSVITV